MTEEKWDVEVGRLPRCPVCGEYVDTMTPHCPMCGAKLRKPRDSNYYLIRRAREPEALAEFLEKTLYFCPPGWSEELCSNVCVECWLRWLKAESVDSED